MIRLNYRMSSLPSISKMSNDELARLGMDELIRMFRKCDGERVQLMASRSSMMTDFNRRMQVVVLNLFTTFLSEIYFSIALPRLYHDFVLNHLF